jgi:hypothetical protein
MVNIIILAILRRKIEAGELTIEQVKIQVYKDALMSQ